MAGAPIIRRSALHAFHLSAGASMAEDQGWQCPDSYGSVEAEVQAVRERVGVSDISPLSKLDIQGNNAFASLGQWFSLGLSLETPPSGTVVRIPPKSSILTQRRAGCCVPWPRITPGSSPRPERPVQSNPTLSR